jgi:hypothetical protein
MDEFEIRQGNALELLRTLPDSIFHCCITSPPHWGLRDYGVAGQIWDGDRDHPHIWEPLAPVNATNHIDKRRWNHARNGRGEEQPPRSDRGGSAIKSHKAVSAVAALGAGRSALSRRRSCTSGTSSKCFARSDECYAAMERAG